jgi:hydroxypyruvate isomerase
MLKFAANLSLLFTELPLIDRFSAARKQGFDAVEIQFPYNLSIKTLQQVLQANDLKLVLFNVAADDLMQGGEGLASVPEKRALFKTALQQAVNYANVLKPETINILAGRCFNIEREEQYLKTFKENLLLAVEQFAPLGIKTVFEAINTKDMPTFLIHDSEQQLKILAELKQPQLFIQYDIYHAVKMGENPAEFISQYADKIGHIQFADSPQRGQPNTGDIDFDSLFKTIELSNYSGWLGAEYKPIGDTEHSLLWFQHYRSKSCH